MATYTCKWCGVQATTPQGIVNFSCSKSPHKQHELMNATEKLSQYTCKYCGVQATTPQGIVNFSCSKSPHPNKQHELLG
ncbi:hypothetical protein [Helicobacter sp. T3_23-1059]